MQFVSRSPVIAQNGMAATSHPFATRIAVELLMQGGSAVDAAIGANAALGLMEPTGCGVGGDLFAIVWDPKTRRLHGINASGRSPRGLSYDEMVSRVKALRLDSVPAYGPLSVSVPGAVDGWFELHGRFGAMPMDGILCPAIRYAREGFPVTHVIAKEWEDNIRAREENAELVGELENFRSTYLTNGRAPREGEVFRNRRLAETYEAIAAGGREVFYRGRLAEVIDSYMRRIGGPLRKEDLESHTSTWIDPVSTNYRGYQVYELPPNGQGIAALQMLNLVEGFDLGSMGHNSADYLHVHVESKKLAYEDRAALYTDPDFFDVPVAKLLSKEYADNRRGLISMESAVKDVESGGLFEGDTIYLATADSTGMMVSLIQSNYRGMGSGLVPDDLGFGFQDRGELFALDPDHPNVYAPGKRPFHTIIPAFVMKDGEPFMSFGVMGGAMQPQGHVQILCNIIDFDMNVQEAGDAPRYRHDGSSEPTGSKMRDGGELHIEHGISAGVAEQLRARGHAVEYSSGGFGGYQAIMRDQTNGVYRGASEMRKDGNASGY